MVVLDEIQRVPGLFEVLRQWRALDTSKTGNMLSATASPMPAKNRPATTKMQAYRARLRAQGLRPVQIWVPDVDAPRFKSEVRRQIRRLDPAQEADTLDFIAAVAEDPAR